MFQCMDDLLKSHIKWKYFINLTGQEFPLKTNLELVRILKSLDGANSMDGSKEKQVTEKLSKSVLDGRFHLKIA